MLELATPADWAVVNRLSVQIHDLHAAWRPDIYYSCDEPYPYTDFMTHMAEKRVYVAKFDREVVGYLVLSFLQKDGAGTHSAKIARLESICVEECLRGRGIGTQMVMEARILAKAFGSGWLTLGVHAENDEAVGFYQKCGFRIRTIQMDQKI